MLERATGEALSLVWERWGPLKSLKHPPHTLGTQKMVSSRPTNRKPKATVTQVGIESFPSDTRLHHHREVFCIQLHDSVHMGQVDAYTTLVARVPRTLPNLGL